MRRNLDKIAKSIEPTVGHRIDYYQIEYELEQSPAIRLLRSHNAALIIGFLHAQFKAQKSNRWKETKFSAYS